MALSRPASRYRPPDRALGRRSGCWALTSRRWVGRGAAKLTSWSRAADGAASLHGAGGYELPFPVPFDIGADWHEYALDWRRDKISTSMDGRDFASWTPASLPPGATWTFNDHPMYVILNMAVGGPPFVPDSSTQFPATMLVDWVRYTPAT